MMNVMEGVKEVRDRESEEEKWVGQEEGKELGWVREAWKEANDNEEKEEEAWKDVRESEVYRQKNHIDPLPSLMQSQVQIHFESVTLYEFPSHFLLWPLQFVSI